MTHEKKVPVRHRLLKIKIKSLAAEASIIREEERRLCRRLRERKSGALGLLREEMYRHRIDVVRRVARETHLAYGYLRGHAYRRIEPATVDPRHQYLGPNWKTVAAMVAKYGNAVFDDSWIAPALTEEETLSVRRVEQEQRQQRHERSIKQTEHRLDASFAQLVSAAQEQAPSVVPAAQLFDLQVK